MSDTPDIVVIGAGAAGIAAARTALSLGLAVTVLEAKDRVGGRAYTRTTELGFPFDYGAHWMHSASRNPLVAFADQYGFEYARLPPRRRLHWGDRWASDADEAAWGAYVERQWRLISAAAADPQDIAVAAAIEPHEAWREPFLAWFAMLSSVEAELVSAQDHANYCDTAENWPLRQGFGALIARLSDGLPVRLDCPVTAVRWDGPGVVVDLPAGRLRAGAAIVTVSTGVLAHDTIRFRPALPAATQTAIAGLLPGRADKIGVAFDRDVFGPNVPEAALSMMRGREVLSFQIRPFGENVAIGFAGGDFADALEALEAADVTALALDQLADMFGSTLRRHVRATVRTRWGADPYIRGGYSAAAVGHADARTRLATALDDRLFFAGEATSRIFFSTVHGAYLSGVAAAQSAAAALGIARSVAPAND